MKTKDVINLIETYSSPTHDPVDNHLLFHTPGGGYTVVSWEGDVWQNHDFDSRWPWGTWAIRKAVRKRINQITQAAKFKRYVLSVNLAARVESLVAELNASDADDAIEDGYCPRCNQLVVVPDGLDYDDGDWCYLCWLDWAAEASDVLRAIVINGNRQHITVEMAKHMDCPFLKSEPEL